jgi:hypothetical protein
MLPTHLSLRTVLLVTRPGSFSGDAAPVTLEGRAPLLD